jgi:hypothetical protein
MLGYRKCVFFLLLIYGQSIKKRLFFQKYLGNSFVSKDKFIKKTEELQAFAS